MSEEADVQLPEVGLEVEVECYPAPAATYYRLPEVVLRLAAIPDRDKAATYYPGAEEPRHLESADGSEGKSPVGELWGVRSHLEDEGAPGRGDWERLYHSRDLPARKEAQSDESDDRVEQGVILGPGDRDSLDEIAHVNNTRFLHVRVPQRFFFLF